MRKIFPSIEHPENAYVFESGNYDHRAGVDARFRMFEHYGHTVKGDNGPSFVQHSPDWAITQEFAADYFTSLAQAMLSEPPDTEDSLANTVRFVLRPVDRKQIEFAATLKFKDGEESKPTRYYNLQERKTSSNSNKRWDTRWHRIESWMDGSAQSILRIVLPESPSNLDLLATACGLYDLASDLDVWVGNPVLLIKWFGSDSNDFRDKANDLHEAYNAARAAIRAYEYRMQVVTYLENSKLRRKETTNA
jgi:hypothetical protein